MDRPVVKPPMLLIVEPDPLLLTGISAILDKQGYRCFLSRDLSVARKATEKLAFDLFILSMGENVEEGEKMARELRAANQTVDVPVIFLAPKLDPNWVGRLNAVGGVYCLPKPFDPNLLIQLVDRAVWMPHLVHAHVAPPKAHFEHDWVRLN